jgi:hypothetical protein
MHARSPRVALALLATLAFARGAAAQDRPAVIVTDPTAGSYRAAVQEFAGDRTT